jgi:hypothetical protein
MTEDQIERKIQRFVDHLDWVFMHQSMSQADYDANLRAIHEWAEARYAEAERCRFAYHLLARRCEPEKLP